MLHLFAIIWDLLHHHRRHWLGVFLLLIALSIAADAGMERLNASLVRRLDASVQVQQPSAAELRRIRLLQRRTQRMQRLAQLRPAASEPFPAIGYAVMPVDRAPDWGAMRTPAEWNRTYREMTAGDFVSVPPYDLDVLTMPMSQLLSPLTSQTIPAVTAKLFYSTRFLGSYDVDSNEGEGRHMGIDFKLALGTPVGAIAGGRVSSISRNDDLGIFVMVEHRTPAEGTLFSVYGHLGATTVKEGQNVEPGQTLGFVGMTGKTTGPHLHLQIDRGQPGARHQPYHPDTIPSQAALQERVVHPMRFIERYRGQATAVL